MDIKRETKKNKKLNTVDVTKNYKDIKSDHEEMQNNHRETQNNKKTQTSL